MNELFSIAGKVAVITGAGGVLGGNIAQHFVQQGAKVVAIDIRQEQLDKRVEELKAYGEDVIGIVGNVLDIASLEKLADDIVAKWGRIDILLNIAGGNMPGATLAPDQNFFDMDVTCWEKVTSLNMNGTVYPSMVFSKVMAKQGKGCIVNVSSMAAYSAITRVPGYSAAKTAVANFTQWLASELALKYGCNPNQKPARIFMRDGRFVQTLDSRYPTCTTGDRMTEQIRAAIGEGASLFDIPGFGADFAYTVDGGDVGGIEYENFNAASATVTVHGFSVHPGSAKDAMINASNVAMEFHMALPAMARPETTEGYQGFYHLCQMYGDVTEAKLGYILRDHDIGKLQFKKDNLLHIACYLNGKYGPGTVEVEIKDSYRNMLEKIKPHFHLVETARKAIEKAGLTPEEIPVRGGTDGAVLSWKGLPCPNLGTGGFNFHGVCECTTVERMDKATEILLNIIELYSK